MNRIDPQKEARVWERVKGAQMESSSPEAGIQNLLANEWASASAYLQIARQMSSREAAILQRLARAEQTDAACLKGIFALITGERPAVQAVPPPRETPALALRRCYGAEMRSLKEYESRSQDPEYGPVFARLAEQEREHCRTVLELLGSLHQNP